MDPETHDLMAAFRARTLPQVQWTHAAHIRVGWGYCAAAFAEGTPFAEVLARFVPDLKAYNAHNGKAAAYHDTITKVMLGLIETRCRTMPARGRDWAAFASANPDLFAWEPSILDRYYSREHLFSDAARQSYLPPDKAAFSEADLSQELSGVLTSTAGTPAHS